MDYPWTPNSSRPNTLYRVYRPWQHTRWRPQEGLTSTDRATLIKTDTHLDAIPAFLTSVRDHREQDLIPSPYISFFEDKEEARTWALAAEEYWGEVCYVMEIDARSEVLEEIPMFKIADLQRLSGDGLGRGGARDSEWLVLYHVPHPCIRRRFVSTTEIRAERCLPDASQVSMESVYYRAKSQFPRGDSVPPYDALLYQQDDELGGPKDVPQNALGLLPACEHGCLTLENCSHKSNTTTPSQAGRSEEGGE